MARDLSVLNADIPDLIFGDQTCRFIHVSLSTAHPGPKGAGGVFNVHDSWYHGMPGALGRAGVTSLNRIVSHEFAGGSYDQDEIVTMTANAVTNSSRQAVTVDKGAALTYPGAASPGCSSNLWTWTGGTANSTLMGGMLVNSSWLTANPVAAAALKIDQEWLAKILWWQSSGTTEPTLAYRTRRGAAAPQTVTGFNADTAGTNDLWNVTAGLSCSTGVTNDSIGVQVLTDTSGAYDETSNKFCAAYLLDRNAAGVAYQAISRGLIGLDEVAGSGVITTAHLARWLATVTAHPHTATNATWIVFIDLCTYDIVNGYTTAAMQADLVTIREKFVQAGANAGAQVLFLQTSPPPLETSVATLATYGATATAIRETAGDYGDGFLDIFGLFGREFVSSSLRTVNHWKDRASVDYSLDLVLNRLKRWRRNGRVMLLPPTRRRTTPIDVRGVTLNGFVGTEHTQMVQGNMEPKSGSTSVMWATAGALNFTSTGGMNHNTNAVDTASNRTAAVNAAVAQVDNDLDAVNTGTGTGYIDLGAKSGGVYPSFTGIFIVDYEDPYVAASSTTFGGTNPYAFATATEPQADAWFAELIPAIVAEIDRLLPNARGIIWYDAWCQLTHVQAVSGTTTLSTDAAIGTRLLSLAGVTMLGQRMYALRGVSGSSSLGGGNVDTSGNITTAINSLLNRGEKMAATYGKPVLYYDWFMYQGVGSSVFVEPAYMRLQRDAITADVFARKQLFARLGTMPHADKTSAQTITSFKEDFSPQWF